MLLCAPSLARAQAPTDLMVKEAKGVQFSVLWGFDGSTMHAERWSPIRIVVNSGDKPVSGVIQITYRQDASQSMRIVLPFATTPGVFVPIEAALALPSGCDSIRFQLFDERGKRLRSHAFSQNSARVNEQMPQILTGTGIPLLSIGDTRLPEIVPAISYESFGETPVNQTADADDFWSRLIISRADPLSLPTFSMAYDALGAIVIKASSVPRLGFAVKEAIRRWVSSGGMIVLIADDPTESWRALLSPPNTPDAFRLGPMATPIDTEVLDELVEVTPNLSARTITLTEAGVGAGWTQRWTGSQGRSYIAEGPVGLGWATVLGVDPLRVPAVVSNDQTALLWRDILRDTIAHWSKDLPPSNWYWGSMGREPSGATPRQRAAISAVLDHSLDAPAPSAGVFILLIFAVVALAFFVGPVDAIGLKKLEKRQHSWATALAYITIACIPAFFAPVVLRTGKTMYARSRCVDTLPPSLGGASFQTGISSTFAGDSGQILFPEPGAGSWWRPVSSLQTWATSQGTGATLDCVQSAVSLPSGRVRQNAPNITKGNAQRLWTLRTLMDQQPTPAPPSASLDADLSHVRIAGLPDGARVTSGALLRIDPDAPRRSRQSWFDLGGATVPSGADEIAFVLAMAQPTPPANWEPLDIPEENPWLWNSTILDFRSSRLADLPGARPRTRAINAYLTSGRYALLQLELEHDTPDIGLSVENAITTVHEVHRIIIPVPEQTP